MWKYRYISYGCFCLGLSELIAGKGADFVGSPPFWSVEEPHTVIWQGLRFLPFLI